MLEFLSFSFILCVIRPAPDTCHSLLFIDPGMEKWPSRFHSFNVNVIGITYMCGTEVCENVHATSRY